jgi:hypothetical protein
MACGSAHRLDNPGNWLLKTHGVPCHRQLELYLVAYLDQLGINHLGKLPVFQTFHREAEENGIVTLRPAGRAMTRGMAWAMLQWRAKKAGIKTIFVITPSGRQLWPAASKGFGRLSGSSRRPRYSASCRKQRLPGAEPLLRAPLTAAARSRILFQIKNDNQVKLLLAANDMI